MNWCETLDSDWICRWIDIFAGHKAAVRFIRVAWAACVGLGKELFQRLLGILLHRAHVGYIIFE